MVRLVSKFPKDSLCFAISSQIVRSGTSIGANVEEAQNASSKREFIRGITIALKEARETLYWLRILKETRLISLNLKDLIFENTEIIKILTSSVKKAKTKL